MSIHLFLYLLYLTDDIFCLVPPWSDGTAFYHHLHGTILNITLFLENGSNLLISHKNSDLWFSGCFAFCVPAEVLSPDWQCCPLETWGNFMIFNVVVRPPAWVLTLLAFCCGAKFSDWKFLIIWGCVWLWDFDYVRTYCSSSTDCLAGKRFRKHFCHFWLRKGLGNISFLSFFLWFFFFFFFLMCKISLLTVHTTLNKMQIKQKAKKLKQKRLDVVDLLQC